MWMNRIVILCFIIRSTDSQLLSKYTNAFFVDNSKTAEDYLWWTKDLFSGLLCIQVAYDRSPFPLEVLRNLLESVPLILTEGCLDAAYCGQMLLIVTRIEDIPDITFETKDRRVLLLSSSSNVIQDVEVSRIGKRDVSCHIISSRMPY